MGISVKRVLLGGLVAGVIIIISAVSMVPVVGQEMDLALARFNLPPLSPAAMVFFAATSLLFGVTLVWLFAAILPRIPQRTTAAITVALLVWLIGYLLPNFAMVVYGFMPLKLTVVGTAWGLGELLLASILGTRLYKDEEISVPR